MGVTSIIRVINDAGGITRVRYTRDDGTVWTNECRVDPLRSPGECTTVRRGAGELKTPSPIGSMATRFAVRLSMDGELVSEKTYTIR